MGWESMWNPGAGGGGAGGQAGEDIPPATWEVGHPAEEGTSPSPARLPCRWPQGGLNALLRSISALQHLPKLSGSS